MEKCVHIAHRVTPPHVVHRTGQCMGEDGERFALAMFFLHAGPICWADRIIPEKEYRRFRKRPLERGIADLRA